MEILKPEDTLQLLRYLHEDLLNEFEGQAVDNWLKATLNRVAREKFQHWENENKLLMYFSNFCLTNSHFEFDSLDKSSLRAIYKGKFFPGPKHKLEFWDLYYCEPIGQHENYDLYFHADEKTIFAVYGKEIHERDKLEITRHSPGYIECVGEPFKTAIMNMKALGYRFYSEPVYIEFKAKVD